MHFLKLEHTQLHPDQKIIKADQLRVFRDAEAVLVQAKAEGEQMLAQAKATFEEERQRGYQQGIEAGKQEMSEHLVRTVKKSVTYLSEIEHSMVDVVLASVKTIAENFSDRDQIRTVVSKLLAQAQTGDQVVLWVSKEDFEGQRADLKQLHQRFPEIGEIRIELDSNLSKSECVLETQVGKVASTLESQLQAIENTLRKNLTESPA